MKKALLSFMAFMTMVTSPTVTNAARLDEILVGIGTGLLSGAVCRELGASRDLQAFCAIGGALIGSNAAREMNRQDAEEFSRAQEEAFYGDLNRGYDWDARQRGSRSGVRGRIVVIEEGYHYNTRETCRVYQSRTHYGRGQMEEKTSTVCRKSNGQLYTLENTTYYRRGQVVSSETTETYGRDYDRRGRGRRPVTPRPPVYEPRPVPPITPVQPYCNGWSAQNLYHNQIVYTRSGLSAYYLGYNNYDSTVTVRSQGYTQTLRLGDIAIPGCHYNLQSGSYVSTRRGFSGQVLGVFMNGDVALQAQGYVYVMNRSDIY